MTIVLALAVFAVSASAIAQEAPLQLAENVWQVNFQDNPGAFARLVSCAMHHQLNYGILQPEDAPIWHPASFQPKPHLSRPDPIGAWSSSGLRRRNENSPAYCEPAMDCRR